MAPPPSHADLPALTTVLLPYTAFYYYTSLHTSSPLPVPFSHTDIGALANHPSLPPPLPTAITITASGLQPLATTITAITIAHASGNDPTLTAVDFSPFKQAKTITIGSHCFRHVTSVKIKGMPLLERVEIGANSFRNTNSTYGDTNEDFGGEYQDYNPRKKFCLSDCPKVKALVLGNGALIDAGICVIKNVPALEEIVMGDMDNTHPCGCFESGSLKLNSWVEVGI